MRVSIGCVYLVDLLAWFGCSAWPPDSEPAAGPQDVAGPTVQVRIEYMDPKVMI